MGWVPTSAWLSKVTIDAAAPDLTFDLAIDASGAGAPSRLMAGLDLPGTPATRGETRDASTLVVGLGLFIFGVGGIVVLLVRRRRAPLSAA
jgi:hypothetical protein